MYRERIHQSLQHLSQPPLGNYRPLFLTVGNRRAQRIRRGGSPILWNEGLTEPPGDLLILKT